MKWKQKNGELIEIADMSDRHLLNTIALVERNYVRDCLLTSANALFYAYMSTTPDSASLCAEGEAFALEEEAEDLEYIDKAVPIYKHLVKEAKKRKLNYGNAPR